MEISKRLTSWLLKQFWRTILIVWALWFWHNIRQWQSWVDRIFLTSVSEIIIANYLIAFLEIEITITCDLQRLPGMCSFYRNKRIKLQIWKIHWTEINLNSLFIKNNRFQLLLSHSLSIFPTFRTYLNCIKCSCSNSRNEAKRIKTFIFDIFNTNFSHYLSAFSDAEQAEKSSILHFALLWITFKIWHTHINTQVDCFIFHY